MFYPYLYFIILTLTYTIFVLTTSRGNILKDSVKKKLLHLHIVPLSCWAFDVLTTLYVIDYLGVARELNPLGWPFGAWGALIFYIPAVIFTYMLLFRIENRYSSWAAVLVTMTALGCGATNLLAGLHNIEVAIHYT
jgi:hypothetical protein